NNNFPVIRANRIWRVCAFRLLAQPRTQPRPQQEQPKMARDDRVYAFIIAHTSRSRARVQRIRVDKKLITIVIAGAALFSVGLGYGLYGLTQHAAHIRTDFENQRLRAENERQRIELEKLNNRVEKVEDTSRKLAEKSGVVEHAPAPGSG